MGQRQDDDTFNTSFQKKDGCPAAVQSDVFSDESCRRVLSLAFAGSMISLIVNWAKQCVQFVFRCVVFDCIHILFPCA
jgi:hypothetical protein